MTDLFSPVCSCGSHVVRPCEAQCLPLGFWERLVQKGAASQRPPGGSCGASDEGEVLLSAPHPGQCSLSATHTGREKTKPGSFGGMADVGGEGGYCRSIGPHGVSGLRILGPVLSPQTSES